MSEQLQVLGLAYYHQHKRAVEFWEHGEPKKIWFNKESQSICIRYTSGTWFHYTTTNSGHLEWW